MTHPGPRQRADIDIHVRGGTGYTSRVPRAACYNAYGRSPRCDTAYCHITILGKGMVKRPAVCGFVTVGPVAGIEGARIDQYKEIRRVHSLHVQNEWKLIIRL